MQTRLYILSRTKAKRRDTITILFLYFHILSYNYSPRARRVRILYFGQSETTKGMWSISPHSIPEINGDWEIPLSERLGQNLRKVGGKKKPSHHQYFQKWNPTFLLNLLTPGNLSQAEQIEKKNNFQTTGERRRNNEASFSKLSSQIGCWFVLPSSF